MIYNFTAEIIKDNEINQYVAIAPGLPGAHTQAPTLDELNRNLHEVIQLCLQEMSEEEKLQLPEFVGIQNISIAV
jgi:predicted RNase H-like HicB family nuclease